MDHESHSADPRTRLQEWVAHLEHVLPGQAPIKDFVHHNTLHGFQHLSFPEALTAARKLTGAKGYLPPERCRQLFREGRIDAADLEAALRETEGFDANGMVMESPALRQVDVQIAALSQPVAPVCTARLVWEVEENAALTRIQAEVAEAPRRRLLAASGGREAQAAGDLWAACLEVLEIDLALLHPEEALERFDREDAEVATDTPLADGAGAAGRWNELEARLGLDWTVRDLLLALTGVDIFDGVRPGLIRQLGAHLDQGMAAWHHPQRRRGFYAAWRTAATRDAAWNLRARREIANLPDDALDAVVRELERLGLAPQRWTGYLERLALELPGWSGMFLWRHLHPGYADGGDVPVAMMDYLAVRLVLERQSAEALVRRQWNLPLHLPALADHFRRRGDELAVRGAYRRGMLPEYLATHLHCLEGAAPEDDAAAPDWRRLARGMGESQSLWDGTCESQLLWDGTSAGGVPEPAALRGAGAAGGLAWPLFLLAQHLGISGGELREGGRTLADALLAATRRFDADAAGYIWLRAYERHYREQIFAALAANHGRCAGAAAPPAQLVFCMDDREEGMRRHLEEINPRLETLGAAAHFNVFLNWRGLDDERVTMLCPVVARPAHEVRELARAQAEAALAQHRSRRAKRMAWRERLHQGTRRGLLTPLLLSAAAAPAALAALLARSVVPSRLARAGETLRQRIDGTIPTRIEINVQNDPGMAVAPATPEQPRLGFTDEEQADRVQAFLRNIGLTRNFAPLVVILGHGSWSQNNPHLAAYDCGACSGRHSGPNARLFAAMANRPPVRGLLAQRGIEIPDTTWFLGGEHNTCDDVAELFDTEDLPESHRAGYESLCRDLVAAGHAHARERCRRFASAPGNLTLDQAWWHVEDRRNDYSQARPELGHATNAAAFIGRRSLSRGAFFDRRAFLISYDPSGDADGRILEGLLLANGPVGAGISLEYYFSTVNNEHYGCGTKTQHNVVGMFGVMQGAASDLRTGLPRQMIEIHEAMRLLVVVEARLDIVTAIYERQPPLQELIGKGWIVVAAKDPDSPAIALFDPARGWVPWQGEAQLKTVAASYDWFKGKRDALEPVLLTRPLEATA